MYQQFTQRNFFVLKVFVLIAALALSLFSPLVPKANAGGECGGGYYMVGSYAIYNNFNERTGTLEVYWNNSSKRNCAINRAYGKNYGVYRIRYVGIKLSGTSTWSSDSGNFRYYAGPVYTGYSAGRCIDVLGTVEDGWDGYRRLLNVHCG